MEDEWAEYVATLYMLFLGNHYDFKKKCNSLRSSPYTMKMKTEDKCLIWTSTSDFCAYLIYAKP